MAPHSLELFRQKATREHGSVERTRSLLSRLSCLPVLGPKRTLERQPRLAALVTLVGLDRAGGPPLDADEVFFISNRFSRILKACRNVIEVQLDISGVALQEQLAILQGVAQGAHLLTRLYIELPTPNDVPDVEPVNPAVFKIVSALLLAQPSLTSLALIAPLFRFEGPPPTFQLRILRAYVNAFAPKNFAETFATSATSLRSLTLSDPLLDIFEADWTVFPNLTSLGLASIPFNPIPRYRHLTTLPLRQLYLPYLDQPDFDLLPNLPPTITQLAIAIRDMVFYIERVPHSTRTPGARPRPRPSSYPSLGGPLVLPRPSSPRATSPLPNEIIALILEQIAEDPAVGNWGLEPLELEDFKNKARKEDGALDRETLASCCLVSRDFLYPARKNLYIQVELFEPQREDGRTEQLVWTLETHPHLAALVTLVGLTRADKLDLKGEEIVYAANRLARILKACHNVIQVDVDVSGSALQEELAILRRVEQATNDLTSLFIELPNIGDEDDIENQDVSPEVFRIVSALFRSKSSLTNLAFIAPYFRLEGPPPTFQLQVLWAFVHSFILETFSRTFTSSVTSLQSLSLAVPYTVEREPDWTIFPNLTSLGLASIPSDPASRYHHLTSLPLRILYLEYLDRPDFDLLPLLPSTIIQLIVPVHSPKSIVKFLSSGAHTHLDWASFRGLEGGTALNPWSWITVAHARLRKLVWYPLKM
ncbi:hypothetical protein RQP46_001514 [Phenoliferia psychrophenolica]